MAQRALAVDRMSERRLWDTILRDLLEIECYEWSGAPPRTRKYIAREARLCAEELRLRGSQLSLGLGE